MSEVIALLLSETALADIQSLRVQSLRVPDPSVNGAEPLRAGERAVAAHECGSCGADVQ